MSSRRGCLSIAAIVAALLVAGSVVAYRGLDPDALRALAERHASAMLGAPVTIGRMRVSLFPTPAVTGTDVRLRSASAGRAPAISVRGIRILPQWRTLIAKPLVIDAVEIEGLTLLVRRDAEGRWLLPGAPGNRSAPDSTSAAVPRLPGGSAADAVAVRAVRLRDGQLVVVDDVLRTAAGSAEVAAIRHIDADLAQRTGGTGALSMRAALGGSPLTGTMEMGPQGLSASVQSPSIRNEDVPAVFALLGSAAPEGLALGGDAPLDLTMRVARDTGALTASGHLRAARVQFATATVTGVAAPFRVAEHVLTVDPLTFSAYSGAARARLDARYGEAPVAWTLALGAQGIDANAFLSANTAAGDRLLGTGRIGARLRGTAATPIAPHVNGTVDVALSNGVIRHFALIAAINRALRITEGEGDDLRFDRLAATIHVAGGAMRTDDARLTAGDLSVTAAGTIGFDRAIGMTGTAQFSREASARMIAGVNQISGARNERGEVEVPFTVSGSLDRPAFAIDTGQILGRAVRKEVERNIRKRLGRFLGRP